MLAGGDRVLNSAPLMLFWMDHARFCFCRWVVFRAVPRINNVIIGAVHTLPELCARCAKTTLRVHFVGGGGVGTFLEVVLVQFGGRDWYNSGVLGYNWGGFIVQIRRFQVHICGFSVRLICFLLHVFWAG